MVTPFSSSSVRPGVRLLPPVSGLFPPPSRQSAQSSCPVFHSALSLSSAVPPLSQLISLFSLYKSLPSASVHLYTTPVSLHHYLPALSSPRPFGLSSCTLHR